MVPFFTSFLLRTIAWQSLLNDNGPVLGVIEAFSADGIIERASGCSSDGRLLNTQVAVIGGLTYNFLPFMLLPIYVSLEKIDIRLVDAASRPLLVVPADVPQGDPAAVAARRVRRDAADVHPGDR